MKTNPSFVPVSERVRWSMLLGFGGFTWLATLGAATAVRLSIADGNAAWGRLGLLAAIAFIATLLARQHPRVHVGRTRRGSVSDARATTAVWGAVSIVVLFANFFVLGRPVPTGAVALALPLALVLQLGIRLSWRAVFDSYRKPELLEGRQRVIVFGAGEGGAIPSANAAVVSELDAFGRAAGLEVRVLPSTSELLGLMSVDLRDIRELTEADLLGRSEVEVDLDSIRGYIEGRHPRITHTSGSEELSIADAVQLSEVSRRLIDRCSQALTSAKL